MILVLKHLEAVGFEGAPRVLGTDAKGRSVLTYIPGRTAVPPYPRWSQSDQVLISVARLLRRFHDAMAGFRGPDDVIWPTVPPLGYCGGQVGHMDVSMANVVHRNGRAVALIDFEEVGLAARIWDIARTVRHWVPLLDPSDLPPELADLANRQATRIERFTDAYGLDKAGREGLIDAALANADWTFERMRLKAEEGHPGYLAEWKGNASARNRRGRAWLERNRRELYRALQA